MTVNVHQNWLPFLFFVSWIFSLTNIWSQFCYVRTFVDHQFCLPLENWLPPFCVNLCSDNHLVTLILNERVFQVPFKWLVLTYFSVIERRKWNDSVSTQTCVTNESSFFLKQSDSSHFDFALSFPSSWKKSLRDFVRQLIFRPKQILCSSTENSGVVRNFYLKICVLTHKFPIFSRMF